MDNSDINNIWAKLSNKVPDDDFPVDEKDRAKLDAFSQLLFPGGNRTPGSMPDVGELFSKLAGDNSIMTQMMSQFNMLEPNNSSIVEPDPEADEFIESLNICSDPNTDEFIESLNSNV